MSDELRYTLLAKFPSLNPGWPPELQAQWFAIFDRLLAMKEPPPVAGAKRDGDTATQGPPPSHNHILIQERARRLWAEAYLKDIAEETGRTNEMWTWGEETEQDEWRTKAAKELRAAGLI
jgi:hypothetical protein